jgi:hypothetical protein
MKKSAVGVVYKERREPATDEEEHALTSRAMRSSGSFLSLVRTLESRVAILRPYLFGEAQKW